MVRHDNAIVSEYVPRLNSFTYTYSWDPASGLYPGPDECRPWLHTSSGTFKYYLRIHSYVLGILFPFRLYIKISFSQPISHLHSACVCLCVCVCVIFSPVFIFLHVEPQYCDFYGPCLKYSVEITIWYTTLPSTCSKNVTGLRIMSNEFLIFEPRSKRHFLGKVLQ
jgi:hypothetical protein